MQTVLSPSNQGSRSTEARRAEGFLEDPDGVTRLYVNGESVATLGERCIITRGSCSTDDGPISWWNRQFDSLRWTYKSALFILQGALIQELLGDRIIYLYGRATPVYSMQLGIEDAQFAEIKEAPPGYTARQIFVSIFEQVLG